MKPEALIAYDQHDAIIADLIRLARATGMLPLDAADETITKMTLTGRYHRPGGPTVAITADVADLHRTLVGAAHTFVEAARELAGHPTALNPPAVQRART